MSNWSPRLTELPLSEADLEAIVDEALAVLADIGVECPSAPARRLLAGWPGASASGDRIRLAPAPVRQHLERLRAAGAPVPTDEAPFALGGCWACLTWCDPVTRQVRPATSVTLSRELLPSRSSDCTRGVRLAGHEPVQA